MQAKARLAELYTLFKDTILPTLIQKITSLFNCFFGGRVIRPPLFLPTMFFGGRIFYKCFCAVSILTVLVFDIYNIK
jgi:hypothetical protein